MLLVFNALAVAATFIGGALPSALFTRSGMRNVFAFRSGILLAVAFTEILPSALDGTFMAGWGALAAFAALFAAGQFVLTDTCPEYLEECPVHILSWFALAALWTHSFLDGVNFSVSFEAGPAAVIAVGCAMSIHKLADGFTLTSLFHQARYSRKQTYASLTVAALATPVGSALSRWGLDWLGQGGAASALLGFAGGCFIYIGASDILVRVHRHGDKASLGYFTAGLAGMALLKLF